MLLKNESDVLLVEKIGIAEQEAEKLYIPESALPMKKMQFIYHLTMINGETYYIKYGNVLNELIGSFLAKKIELDSVNYQIGVLDTNFKEPYILSKIFYDRDFEYFVVPRYKKIKTNSIRQPWRENPIAYLTSFISKLDQFDEALKKDLLKLIALDLKMGQTDRHSYNIIFKKNIQTEEIRLAPTYDYGFSHGTYSRPFKCYNNDYLALRLNNIKSFTRKYPQIIEYIDILKNTDMEEILSTIEAEKNIEVTSGERTYYIKENQEYTKILKRI